MFYTSLRIENIQNVDVTNTTSGEYIIFSKDFTGPEPLRIVQLAHGLEIQNLYL